IYFSKAVLNSLKLLNLFWYEPQILDFLIVFGLIPVLNRTKSF
ncbi:hypothetical protein CP02DC22_1125, partial [Chlamydia psittaci 02DC22]